MPWKRALPFFLLASVSAAGFSFDLKDTEGRRHATAQTQGAKALVFLFLGTDCPLSNRYLPELARLSDEYSKRGLLFYAVQSDPAVQVEEARKHARDFQYRFPFLLDSTQSLARQTGVTATPEAAVVSPSGEVLYRGRIDDQVVEFGKSRPTPTRRDLRLALEQILAGQPVSVPVTKAIGCSIPFPARSTRANATFTRDVAPILYQHCAACHHTGGAAPFSLLSYTDASRRAALIATVTASRYMPPWKPQPGFGNFRGERRLTDAEIAVVHEWAQSGAPEGNPAQLLPPPKFSEGWQLGPPDQVARMPAPFSVPGGGPDVYQCFVISPGISENRYVSAIEFKPENRKLVHHALFFADPSGAARRKDAEDPEIGYRCFGSPGFLPARGLGGWSPGAGAVQFPEEAAATFSKGADLVLQVHFHPTGKAETEQSSLGLYFTSTPPRKRIIDIPLGSHDIDIPAGERSYKVRDSFSLPIDVEAVGIIPHAHYLCKDMKGIAVLPDGTKQWLIWIQDWDFNWQEQYQYKNPISLPAETRLEMEFTYDNSGQNPRNPNHPPKRVRWGADITDEMAGLHLQVLPVKMEDLPALTQALWGKMMRTVGGRFFRLDNP